ncbi:uncharacterized protein METZ01_LOCUS149498, partial [marine metagenome]
VIVKDELGFFGKKQNETKCKKCDMEFSSSERLQRHVDKAHAKMSKTHLKRETWGQSKTTKKKEERNVGSS